MPVAIYLIKSSHIFVVYCIQPTYEYIAVRVEKNLTTTFRVCHFADGEPRYPKKKDSKARRNEADVTSQWHDEESGGDHVDSVGSHIRYVYSRPRIDTDKSFCDLFLVLYTIPILLFFRFFETANMRSGCQ